MNYVFDASSIYSAVSSNRPEILARNYTCDLAKYEIGNILIKESRIHKKITLSEQKLLLDSTTKALNFLYLLDIRGSEQEIISVANEYVLSFYDASYVYIAKKLGATLVTEDGKLTRKASRYVQIIKSEDFGNE